MLLDFAHQSVKSRKLKYLYDPNISYVNINDGYNSVKEFPQIKTVDQMKDFITSNLKGFKFNIDLKKKVYKSICIYKSVRKV